MKVWLALYEVNEALLYNNAEYFEEFMKMLHNAYTVCFKARKYVEAEALQEVIGTFEQEREEYLEIIRKENESVLEDSLDNK